MKAFLARRDDIRAWHAGCLGRGMSLPFASRLVRFERASIFYLALAYALAGSLLAAEWVRAVARISDDTGAMAGEWIEAGGVR
jgi:hypothetical protein